MPKITANHFSNNLLANALGNLLNDSQQLQKLKYQAKQNLERFSATRVNEETLNVYYELIKNYSMFNVLRTEELVASK